MTSKDVPKFITAHNENESKEVKPNLHSLLSEANKVWQTLLGYDFMSLETLGG